MNYRERFTATIQHKKVDRVPFDLAGTSLTGVDHWESVKRLRDLLGFNTKYDGWYRKFDDRILKFLDIDIRRVGDILSPRKPLGQPAVGERVH